MKILSFVVAPVLILTCAVFGEERVFTSDSGQKITGSIVSVSGDKVNLKRSDGQTFAIPVSRFSSADEAYIKKWAEDNKGKVPEHLKDKMPRLNLVVTNGARSSKDGDKEGGFINEKNKKLHLKASLTNEDAVYPIPSASISFMVWGESPESGNDTVVYRKDIEKFELPLNINKTFETELFEVWYDDIGAMYGHEYKGYFVVVTDQEGKVLGHKTMPVRAGDHVDNIKLLKVGDCFDRSYEKVGTERVDRTVKVVRN